MLEHNHKRQRAAAFGVLAAGLLPLQIAQETQGTIPHGYGVKSQGMGGVVIALPQDALAGTSNPAGMVLVGDRLDLGVAFLKVDNGAEFAGTTVSGVEDRGLYVIPQFGANRMLDERSSLGLSLVGTAYGNDANFGGLQEPGAEFQQMVATLSYARQLDERHSVGLGLILVRQVLDIDGTASIGLPQGRDEAYGAGLRGRLTPELSLGASYSTRGYMSKMDKFDRLLAEGGDLDLPSTWALGVAWQRGPLTLAVDVQKIALERRPLAR